MRIALGSDHGGFDLKEQVKTLLRGLGHEVHDAGTNSRESVDYPDIALVVAEAVSKNQADRGILICKTGIGVSIAANKVPGVRAALCANAECARLASEHNQANVLCLSGQKDLEEVSGIIKTWLETPFAGGRHGRRVDKISAIEKKYLKI
jgi:ribose 5-phosphate isomerase B